MPGILLGKLAIITGAGSGIGRATARLFAKEGATIIAGDKHIKSAEETIEMIGGENNHAIELNVASHDSISATLQAVIAKYKRPPTIVVNSAGITRDNFLLKMPEVDFDAVIAVNLKGTFLMTQSFGQAMVDYKIFGSIVNVSSIVARTGNIGQANYSPSKAGVEALTRVASREFGRYNIRVNAVVPGFIKSPMTDHLPQKVKDIVIQQSAMGRFGEPSEIAQVISFLASERASFVNGTSIEATGG